MSIQLLSLVFLVGSLGIVAQPDIPPNEEQEEIQGPLEGLKADYIVVLCCMVGWSHIRGLHRRSRPAGVQYARWCGIPPQHHTPR